MPAYVCGRVPHLVNKAQLLTPTERPVWAHVACHWAVVDEPTVLTPSALVFWFVAPLAATFRVAPDGVISAQVNVLHVASPTALGTIFLHPLLILGCALMTPHAVPCLRIFRAM